MSKNIIFLINVVHDKKFQGGGNTLNGVFEYSSRSWKHYADRHNCELFVLDQPLFDIEYMKPNWYKMYILDILEANNIDYDQVLYVDYDTIVTTFPYYNYFNSGVMVFNKKHKSLFKDLQVFYEKNRDRLIWMQNTYCVGNDQPVFNFFVNDIPNNCKLLGYEWNMQDMMRFEVLNEDMLHTKYGYISHYNAGTPPSSQYWIEKTYKYLYENN